MNARSLIELFTSPFTSANEKARKKAEASAAELARIESEAQAVHAQWTDHVQNYERLFNKAEAAKDELQNSDGDLERAKHDLPNLLGKHPANGVSAAKADGIYTRQMSRPIHVAAIEALLEELIEQIKTMKAFGEKNGVPKAALDALAVP